MVRVPRRLRVFTCLLLLIVSIAAAAPPAPSRAVATSTRVEALANGLTVATREIRGAEVVAVTVAVRAGGRDEPPELRGGSHLLEHVHVLGTPTYPEQSALFGALSAVGGLLNAQTDTETTTYYATVPAARLQLAIEVLADIILRSSFPEQAFERERGVVQEEIRGTHQTGLGIALNTFGQALLGHGANDALATVESVRDISRADLLTYRARRYTARNMVIGVVGPVPHAQVMALVSTAFALLPGGEKLPPTPLPPPVEAVRLETRAEGFIPMVLVGQRIPGLDSPDAAALTVLDALLDVPGTRMEDALAAAAIGVRLAGTHIAQYSDSGIWLTYAMGSGSASRAEEVAEVVRRQIRRLQEELVPEAEVRAATRLLAGRSLLAGETVLNQSLRLASLQVLDVYTSEEEWAERLASVTPADIQRVARAHFQPDTFSMLVQR